MPVIVPPKLDERSVETLVEEAKSLALNYAPEWRDHSERDFGTTLLRLSAGMMASDITRLNKVADKSLQYFLNLLGVTRNPPTPASAALSFTVTGDTPFEIQAGSQISTEETEEEAGIIFETDEDVRLAPANLVKCAVVTGFDAQGKYYPYFDKTDQVLKNDQGFDVNWVAFGVSPHLVLLGFDHRIEKVELLVRIKGPIIEALSTILSKIDKERFKYSIRDNKTPKLSGSIEALTIQYKLGKFAAGGKLAVKIKSDWEASTLAELKYNDSDFDPNGSIGDRLFWLALDLSPFLISFRLASELIRPLFTVSQILFNVVPATSTITQTNEILGKSTGEPYQLFQLSHYPIFKEPKAQDPYTHVAIEVEGSDFQWLRTESFEEEKPQFILDPVAGTVLFGNYDPYTKSGDGIIPPRGSRIIAKSCRYVSAGAAGNVARNAINLPIKIVPSQNAMRVSEVTNPLPATGGSDWETVEEACERGPLSVKIRDRAITTLDYEILAKMATTDVVKAKCLPPKRLPDGKEYEEIMQTIIENGKETTVMLLDRHPGIVNLILVPQINTLSIKQPVPDESLVQEVRQYLAERRVATIQELKIIAPIYVPVAVVVDVAIRPLQLGEDENELKDNLRETIKHRVIGFLHPVLGGPNGKGWEIGQGISLIELYPVVEGVDGVLFINSMSFIGGGVQIQVAEHELICAAEDDEFKVLFNGQ